MNLRPMTVACAAAVVAGVAWPWFAAQRAQATAQPAAAIDKDYLLRDRKIAFYEAQVRRDPQDQIVERMLAGEYLQRFRETGDFADVARAQALAQRSLRLQPQGNVQALDAIAASDLAYHRFDAALAAERAALEGLPSDDDARAQIASALMELGRYREAAGVLAHPASADPNPTWMSIRARYSELTGNLRGARIEMARAEGIVDRLVTVSAYARSWYHFRSAQLAFEDGDGAAAAAEFDEALRIFPNNAMALLFEAKLYRARRDWARSLEAARRSAAIVPLPQALGYEADAQRALGDGEGAARTDALVRAEQRLFDAQGVNDRLLAMYYAEHGEHLNDALAAARSDLAKRGDEIYADDTMAWVLAAMGRWSEARVYAERAVRFRTQDPEVQFHAGAIALHAGALDEGRARLRAALALDPQFHPFYADRARRLLDSWSGRQ